MNCGSLPRKNGTPPRMSRYKYNINSVRKGNDSSGAQFMVLVLRRDESTVDDGTLIHDDLPGENMLKECSNTFSQIGRDSSLL